MISLRRKIVWITRTQPSASAAALAFERAGFNTIIAPLLTVEHVKTASPVPDNSVLIFTSQNGVRAFCDMEARRDLPVVTVGDATGQLAQDMGFANVRSAGGTSEDITPLIKSAPDKDALYVHISGNHVRGRVWQDLTQLGLSAERRIYYRSAPVQGLPDIEFKDIDIVALFSPMAAITLLALTPCISHLKAVSISAATDAALGDLPLKNRIIASSPDLESLIAACAR